MADGVTTVFIKVSKGNIKAGPRTVKGAELTIQKSRIMYDKFALNFSVHVLQEKNYTIKLTLPWTTMKKI